MNTTPSPDAFAIERHGELTIIAASPSIESIDPEMEQQVSGIIVTNEPDPDNPPAKPRYFELLFKWIKRSNSISGSKRFTASARTR